MEATNEIKAKKQMEAMEEMAFLESVEERDLEAIQQYIDSGVDINTVNNDGNTALHLAVLKDCYECLEVLLENGANVNKQNNEGNTPLHLAVLEVINEEGRRTSSHLSHVQLLLENNANMDLVNNEKDSAYDIAFDYKEHDVLEIMHDFIHAKQLENKLSKMTNNERKAYNEEQQRLKKEYNEQRKIMLKQQENAQQKYRNQQRQKALQKQLEQTVFKLRYKVDRAASQQNRNYYQHQLDTSQQQLAYMKQPSALGAGAGQGGKRRKTRKSKKTRKGTRRH